MAIICVKGNRKCDRCMDCRLESNVLYYCTACGDGIYGGEDYVDINGKPYCLNCAMFKTAKKEDL